MTSQLMVKINVAPFSQVNKSKGAVNGELLTLSRPTDAKPSDKSRVAQLEHNIKFLQEQHSIMLNDLHGEIEALRSKNRDMQFQLMFVKGAPMTPSTSSSGSEDETKHKIYTSPNQHFTPSLHVELLEKVINDLKGQLQENDNRNVYLAAIVDEQKKKLEKYERDREREQRVAQVDPDLRRKLDEAESTVRRLQKENASLRRENAPPKAAFHHQQEAGASASFHGAYHKKQNQNRHQRRSNQPPNQYNTAGRQPHWFPPLHTQSFYQRPPSDKEAEASATLPNIPQGNQYHQGSGGRRNNNHHHHHRNEARHRNGKEAS